MTLKEFRKNNPEYNDIPDLELADKFYKKFYSDQDETEYYKTLFPNIAAERAEEEEATFEEEEEEERPFPDEEEPIDDLSSPEDEWWESIYVQQQKVLLCSRTCYNRTHGFLNN